MKIRKMEKLKIRLEIMREQNGMLRVRPLADETYIPLIPGVSFEDLKGASLVIEVKTTSLAIEDTWDKPHKML